MPEPESPPPVLVAVRSVMYVQLPSLTTGIITEPGLGEGVMNDQEEKKKRECRRRTDPPEPEFRRRRPMSKRGPIHSLRSPTSLSR